MVPNQLPGFTRGILQVSAHLEAQAAAILLDFPGRTSLDRMRQAAAGDFSMDFKA
jgi:hypothetical protein